MRRKQLNLITLLTIYFDILFSKQICELMFHFFECTSFILGFVYLKHLSP